MKKPESTYKAKLRKQLDAIPNSYFMSIQQVGLRGHPDIIGSVNGMFVGLEIKKNGQEVKNISGRESLQKYVLDQINETGGYATFVHPQNQVAVLGYLNYIAELPRWKR